MTDIIEAKEPYIVVTSEEGPTVITEEKVHVIVEDTSDRHIVTEGETPTVIYTSQQGPPGPPTGPSTEVDNLPFIGSGTGSTKTTTGYYNNLIFEEFGINDELYVAWTFPAVLDKSKDIQFIGTFFPVTTDGADRYSSWEIHVTSHNHHTSQEINGTIIATDLPLSDTAYEISQGSATIDHVFYDFAGSDTIHIKLKRIASSNDPLGRVAVLGLAIQYTTDGKVGEKGEQGIQGPPGDEEVPYAKLIDFIDDDHLCIGEAPPGTLENDPAWRIKYIVFTGDDVSVRWADGSSDFDKAWTSRTQYSYL